MSNRMKRTKQLTTTRLAVDRETIRRLSPDKLALITGGAPLPTSYRATCMGCDDDN